MKHTGIIRRLPGWVIALGLIPTVGLMIDGSAYTLGNGLNQPRSGLMYSEVKLARERARFESRFEEMYTKWILPKLTGEEVRELESVRFEFPLVGEVSGTPMEFYSGRSNGHLFVAMPVLSLLFLEDIATAYAWLYTRGYSLETIDEYITMLRYKQPADFPGRRYPSPLEALQIPDDALDDRDVDQLSLRFRNSAYALILMHELGHIFYRHPGYGGISKAHTRSNETEADRFALDLMARTKTIPMGAILFFQSQAYYMPSKGQFFAEHTNASERDWVKYLQQNITHPLTANRLSEIAIVLYDSAGHYGADKTTVRYMAAELEQVVEILEDEDLQGCMAVVGHRSTLPDLAPRRPKEQNESPLAKWCKRAAYK